MRLSPHFAMMTAGIGLAGKAVVQHLNRLWHNSRTGFPRVVWPLAGIVVAGVLIVPSWAQAGACDLVLDWNKTALSSCIAELKRENEALRLELQTERGINKVARGNICLLAMELKTPGANEIADIACQELRDQAAKKKKVRP
jgi:hypothetical protein